MLDAILSAYPQDCRPISCEALGNAGGFSGARLWKLNAPRGDLCVRRWPTGHPTAEGLNWIHQVLTHVHGRSCGFVPAPLRDLGGNSFVQTENHLWEVTPWMPGDADFCRDPSDNRLKAAMETLARFHLASKSMQSEQGLSRGLVERAEFSSKLASGELRQWQLKLASLSPRDHLDPCKEIVHLSLPLVARLPSQLLSISTAKFELQPCLRDIWHDHVLFTGNEVSGLIDFGGMWMETVAGDIARLLGSLVGGERRRWTQGLAYYEALRPLSDIERLALSAFDRANVALSGLNWVRWLIFEDRTFENTEGVHARLGAIIARLRTSNENRAFLP